MELMTASECKKMSLRDFIEFLDRIPADKWGTNHLSASTRCVMGLLGVAPGRGFDASPMAERLLEITGDVDFFKYWQLVNKSSPIDALRTYASTPRIVRINRGDEIGCNGDTPKERVLNYLRNVENAIRKLGERVG
jgi:hypothetical protein